jgi:hypothetical protein
MNKEPFLVLVENLQRSNQSRRKESQDVQLDLFCTENETIAALIVLNIVNALLAAGANLGTLKIQMAINTARERTVDLLNRFPRNAENAAGRR